MITPTVGRIVWFYTTSQAEKRAAIITKVCDDETVNLCALDHNGTPLPQTNVYLVQPEGERPTGTHCTWTNPMKRE